jgi:glutaminyl-peptide cyclotransferase
MLSVPRCIGDAGRASMMNRVALKRLLRWLSDIGQRARQIVLPASILVLSLSGCRWPGSDGSAIRFNGSRALRHAEKLCALGPRPVGSPALGRAADYIERVLQRNGWEVTTQDFAYRGELVRNVIGKKGSGPVVVIASPYDTRPLADRDPADRSQPIIGANEGASGAAVLLELARVLDDAALEGMQVWLAFLGAEQRGQIDDWDWAVGAQRLAESLVATPASAHRRPEYVLVLHMVGDKDQMLYYEWTSTLWIQEKLWREAVTLGYAEYFNPSHKYVVTQGSHTPFLRWGIPAALIADLDYSYWRTRYDTADKIGADSLERVGRTVERMLKDEPFTPSPAH